MSETPAGSKRVEIKISGIQKAAGEKLGKEKARELFKKGTSDLRKKTPARLTLVKDEEDSPIHEDKFPEGEFAVPTEEDLKIYQREKQQQENLESFLERYRNTELYELLKQRAAEYGLNFQGNLIVSLLKEDLKSPEGLKKDLNPQPEIKLDPQNFARVIYIKDLFEGK